MQVVSAARSRVLYSLPTGRQLPTLLLLLRMVLLMMRVGLLLLLLNHLLGNSKARDNGAR